MAGESPPPRPLREIVYLDQERVHSYVSQLGEGLTVEESAQGSKNSTLTGGVAAGLGPAHFNVGATRGSGDILTTTRVPAHAVLRRLEELLEENALLVQASAATILPGQIGHVRGDATFESWSLLAELADSVQGVALLAAKIHAATSGKVTFQELQKRMRELEKLVKKNGMRTEHDGAIQALGTAVGKYTLPLAIVFDGYINDAKDVVKLFFQNQNHVRIVAKDKTYVGLLRRENLIGATMEEVLFSYGAKPKQSFDMLFYVAEFGRDDTFEMDDLTSRLTTIAAGGFSFGRFQEMIRAVGSAILDLAEEVRRPTGENSAFVVPLAIYRTIRPRQE